MNLSNGWCGPEGCQVLGTTDSGRGGFAIVIISTVTLAFLASYLFYYFAGSRNLALQAVYYGSFAALLLCILVLKNLNVVKPATSSPW